MIRLKALLKLVLLLKPHSVAISIRLLLLVLMSWIA